MSTSHREIEAMMRIIVVIVWASILAAAIAWLL